MGIGKLLIGVVGCCMSAAFLVVPASGASIVTNGDFELGGNPPSGWTLSGIGFTTGSAAFKHGGSTGFGMDNNGITSYLSQMLTTIAGHSYSIDFWFSATPTGVFTPNDMKASFGGTTLVDLVNTNSGFTEYTYTATAAGTSTLLKFEWTTSNGKYLALDDVSVTDLGPAVANGPAAVPVTSSVWGGGMLLGMLGGAAVLRSRRVRA